ncbi:MAG: hypothetical protein QXU11_09995 [Thermoproteota archaeon]
MPERAKVLEYIIIESPSEFSCSKILSDEDIEWLKWASSTEVGNKGREVATQAIEAGELPELGEAKLVAREVKIKGTEGKSRKIDSVFQTEDGHIVIVEFKASKTSKDYLEDYSEDGIEQLKDYKKIIEENGLDLSRKDLGIKKAKDIAAYVVYVFFNLKNKKVEIGHKFLK